MALPTPADDQVRLLLQTVWDELANGTFWPNYGVVDRLLHRRYQLDIDEVLDRTPVELLVGGRSYSGALPSEADELRLTILGVAACQGTESVVQIFLAAARAAADAEAEHVEDGEGPRLMATDVVEGASDGGTPAASPDVVRLVRQVGLLLAYEPWTRSESLFEGGWRIGVTRWFGPTLRFTAWTITGECGQRRCGSSCPLKALWATRYRPS